MLRATERLSESWHCEPLQVFEATRLSPGLMKRTNSQLSRSSRVFVLSGFAPVLLPSRFHSFGNRGCTWAARLTRSISFGSSVVFFGRGLPPWHAVQVRPTASLSPLICSSVSVAPYLCIGSIFAWHETQPSVLVISLLCAISVFSVSLW